MKIHRLKLPHSRFARVVRHLGNRYVVHHVGLESAALAFYLIFAIFPFLIVISMLLNFFQLDLQESLASLSNFLPGEVVGILRGFLRYAAGPPSTRLLVSSLVFSLYFPMRAANSLMFSVRRAYHLGSPRGVVIQTLKNLLYTVALMVTVVLTVVLMTVSNRILDFAVENLRLPEFVADLWASLRFPVTGVVAYFTLYLLYALAQDAPRNWRDLWPGAMAALGGWLTASWLYALYVNRIAHYSLLFGSIGTVVVLLIWLNLTSMALIMGAELNGTLIALRRERLAEDRREAESGTTPEKS